MDTCDRHITKLVYSEAARAHDFQPVTDEGVDPQLCERCQWVRPYDGHRFCTACLQEASR